MFIIKLIGLIIKVICCVVLGFIMMIPDFLKGLGIVIGLGLIIFAFYVPKIGIPALLIAIAALAAIYLFIKFVIALGKGTAYATSKGLEAAGVNKDTADAIGSVAGMVVTGVITRGVAQEVGGIITNNNDSNVCQSTDVITSTPDYSGDCSVSAAYDSNIDVSDSSIIINDNIVNDAGAGSDYVVTNDVDTSGIVFNEAYNNFIDNNDIPIYANSPSSLFNFSLASSGNGFKFVSPDGLLQNSFIDGNVLNNVGECVGHYHVDGNFGDTVFTDVNNNPIAVTRTEGINTQLYNGDKSKLIGTFADNKGVITFSDNNGKGIAYNNGGTWFDFDGHIIGKTVRS